MDEKQQSKTTWRHSEKAADWETRRDGSGEIKLVDTLILDLQPPWLQEGKFMLFKSVSLWYFVMAVLSYLYNTLK
jgi:hypothetical protein